MRRRSLNFRSRRNLWLARKIVSRHPLATRMLRYLLLPQLLGLTPDAPMGTSFLAKRGTDQRQQVVLPPIRSVFRPAFVELTEGDQVVSPMPDEQEEVPASQMASMDSAMEVQSQEPVSVDQPPVEWSDIEQLESEPSEIDRQVPLPETQAAKSMGPGVPEPAELVTRRNATPQMVPQLQAEGSTELSFSEAEAPVIQLDDTYQPRNIGEPVTAKLHQEQRHVDGPVQTQEHVKAKRPRGRIEEQSVQVERAPLPSLLSFKVTDRDIHGTKVPKGANMQVEQGSSEVTSADNLFAPRDGDRSPQAWLARLMGTSATLPGNVVTSSATIETGQEGREVQPGSNKQVESEQPGEINDPILSHSIEGGFTAAGERPFVVSPQVNRNWRMKTNSQSPATEKTTERVNVARPVTPLPQRTRRFLQPLVGIDLAGISVYQDTIAERLTDAYQADAITRGDNVELAAGHQDNTPETLGLLAHEFTHVARLREPRFVPPIVRSIDAQSSSISEEALARQVEKRVKRVAQEQVDQMEPFSIGPASMTIDLSAETTGSVPASSSQRDTWGGLPAPWERLPDWLVAPPAAESSTQVVTIPAQPIQDGYRSVGGRSWVSETYGDSDSQTGITPGNTGIQRAGQERRLIEEEAQTTTSTSQASPDTTKTPEPDLDALARQVYALLKRRLGVEYRRDS